MRRIAMRSSLAIVAALGAALSTGLFEAPARAQGVVPLRIARAYRDQLERQTCSAGEARDASGYVPEGSGKHPLFVYLTGTQMKFAGLDAQALTRQMAERGFMALAVDYDNRTYPYCSGMQSKAHCLFGGEHSGSALSKLCAHPRADCDAGIVVSGFSQGANLASLAKNFDSRVRGAYLLGHGHKAGNFLDVSACMKDAATKLTQDEMRSVNGERDGFFGQTAARVQKQLQLVVGASCNESADCETPSGGGYHMVRDADVKDGKADHCYFFHQADGYCAKHEGLDPAWERGSAAWAMGPSLDWLAARVSDAKSAPPPPPSP